MTTHASSSAQDPASTSSTVIAAAAGRPSFFSKTTSPLRPRTRNLTDFHIRPADPHRRYSPGDVVKGVVVLTVLKPARITHITVALHGFVHVFKSPNNISELTTNEAAYAQSGRTKKSQYFGNGHASLFQDEVVLCGEGRLDPGIYEFEFELEFPWKGLPTSIDFERGTISYQIRSTITRPNTIVPPSSCDRKINFIETVDVGLLAPPKPRLISLEPITRKSRRNRQSRQTEKQVETGIEPSLDARSSTGARTESPLPDDSISQDGSDHTAGPRSPLNSDDFSEVSAGSVVSGCTGNSFRAAIEPVLAPKNQAGSNRSSATGIDKTITATIEMLRGGCLPGDSIPLRISIQHIKRIKSMHGIIITLYRQGRIDSSPPLDMFKDLTGKAAEKMKHEEYYPKSKTGLGGLSLSSAGTTSVFRKDLSQTFAPILIDPVSLSTVISASIRVPEDVFPTVNNTPGQMITFKYYIEVVVDLGGKLSAQGGHVPRLGMMSTGTATNGSESGRSDGAGNMVAAWGGSIVETEQIRREKSVVACLFEVTVGTLDSKRQRGRNNTLSRAQTEFPMDTVCEPSAQTLVRRSGEHVSVQQPAAAERWMHDQGISGTPGHGWHQQHVQTRQEDYGQEPPYDYTVPPGDDHQGTHHSLSNSRMQVPLPEAQLDTFQLSEKEQIRRAEQRLLPSQPPSNSQDTGGPSSSSHPSIIRHLLPSAPAYVDAAPGYALNADPSSGPESASSTARVETSILNHVSADRSLFGSSSFTNDLRTPYAVRAPPEPMNLHLAPTNDSSFAPTTSPFSTAASISSASSQAPIDDKQELERQRLLAEASSPSEYPNDEEVGIARRRMPIPGNAEEGDAFAPSAPILDDDVEIYASGHAPHGYDHSLGLHSGQDHDCHGYVEHGMSPDEDTSGVSPAPITLESTRRGMGDFLPRYQR